MATAPNLVVAGHPGVARKLRETGRFRAVFEVSSAVELRDLSKSGRVAPPAAFMFAPKFAEDLPGAGVPVLANGLVGSGYTVVVHDFFAKRGDVFDPRVTVAAGQVKLSDLFATFGLAEPAHERGEKSAPEPGTGPQLGPRPQPSVQTGPQPQPYPVAQPGWQPNPPVQPTPPVAQPQVHSAPRPKMPLPAPNGSSDWGARTNPHANQWADAAVPAAPRRGRVVAVASAKGGVGKTSTTVSLSVYAARLLQAAGRAGSVALVDTNFQQADVARYLNLKSPTILDLFQAVGALSAETVRGQLAHVPEVDLYALLGPPDAVSADPAMINSALYRRVLAVLRQAFDYVFVDTPVAELYHMTFVDLILPEADAILVPVEPNRVTLEAAGSWLKAITMPQHSRGGGVDPEKLSLVLNRARADVDCGPEDVMDLLPGWRFAGMIPENPKWMQAVNTHQVTALHAGPDLEATFRGILGAVTADPVFETAQVASQPSRWRGLLGLNPK